MENTIPIQDRNYKPQQNTILLLWKMGWFAIGFLNFNNHLQLHCNSTHFYDMNVIEQATWVVIDAIHRMWNHICIQLCNYNATTIVMSCLYWF
jgi:hypothetical protein